MSQHVAAPRERYSIRIMTSYQYVPVKNGPTRIPTPDQRFVNDQAMSIGRPVTSPDAAYVYTMVRPRKPPITAQASIACICDI